MSGARERRSFRDSFRSHFGSIQNSSATRAVRPVSQPAVSPAPASSRTAPPTTSPTTTSPTTTSPAQATPRPANDPPPPPYSAATTGSSSNSAGAAAAAPPVQVPTISVRPASPTPSQRSSASVRPTASNVRTAEDPYAFLFMFDTIFVIDDSGSMAGRSWREVQAVLRSILPICTQRDADGIDIYFLNHKAPPPPSPVSGKARGGYYNITNADTVTQIFESVRPSGGTPTGTRLHSILTPYIRCYEAERNRMHASGDYGDPDPDVIKPVNIIVITDGVPTDDLEENLVAAAKKLDQLEAPPHQVGVQFFRVGNEPDAEEYLKHLDDDLGKQVSGGLRDMVDAVTWDIKLNVDSNGNVVASGSHGSTAALGLTAEGILKAVLGGVVKRIDRLSTGPADAPANNPTAHGNLGAPRRT